MDYEILEGEYADSLTFTKKELEMYDIAATTDNVVEKIRQFKIARNKFLDGYHVRLTQDYRPRLEAFTQHVSDPTGDAVEYNLDNEKEYNLFNAQLSKLYLTMSKEEVAYINDCLICGKTVASVRSKFEISKEPFDTIKSSAIVRFAIVFNIVVYK